MDQIKTSYYRPSATMEDGLYRVLAEDNAVYAKEGRRVMKIGSDNGGGGDTDNYVINGYNDKFDITGRTTSRIGSRLAKLIFEGDIAKLDAGDFRIHVERLQLGKATGSNIFIGKTTGVSVTTKNGALFTYNGKEVATVDQIPNIPDLSKYVINGYNSSSLNITSSNIDFTSNRLLYNGVQIATLDDIIDPTGFILNGVNTSDISVTSPSTTIISEGGILLNAGSTNFVVSSFDPNVSVTASTFLYNNREVATIDRVVLNRENNSRGVDITSLTMPVSIRGDQGTTVTGGNGNTQSTLAIQPSAVGITSVVGLIVNGADITLNGESVALKSDIADLQQQINDLKALVDTLIP